MGQLLADVKINPNSPTVPPNTGRIVYLTGLPEQHATRRLSQIPDPGYHGQQPAQRLTSIKRSALLRNEASLIG